MMNWEAIGAIGEVVGAVAVVATLIYLIAQLKQNTAGIHAATIQANFQMFNQLNTLMIDDRHWQTSSNAAVTIRTNCLTTSQRVSCGWFVHT